MQLRFHISTGVELVYFRSLDSHLLSCHLHLPPCHLHLPHCHLHLPGVKFYDDQLKCAKYLLNIFISTT